MSSETGNSAISLSGVLNSQISAYRIYENTGFSEETTKNCLTIQIDEGRCQFLEDNSKLGKTFSPLEWVGCRIPRTVYNSRCGIPQPYRYFTQTINSFFTHLKTRFRSALPFYLVFSRPYSESRCWSRPGFFFVRPFSDFVSCGVYLKSRNSSRGARWPAENAIYIHCDPRGDAFPSPEPHEMDPPQGLVSGC